MTTRVLSLIGFIVLLGVIALIGFLAWHLFDHQHLIDGLLGGLIGSILTLLVAYVAWVQLGSISKTASADFILRLKKDFFEEETRALVQLIDKKWLAFVESGEESFFEVDRAGILRSALPQEIQRRLLKRAEYSIYDIDDMLLGHFEDLGTLWKARVVDIGMVYEIFSWYIETVWENEEIRKYVETQRQVSDDIYENFEFLYEKCKMIR
jgi:hypothetical protein